MQTAFNGCSILPNYSEALTAFERVDTFLTKQENELNKISGGPENIEWARKKLEILHCVDQAPRETFNSIPPQARGFFYHLFRQKWGDDRKNTRDLKEILQYHDWITIPLFGEDLNKAALLIAIHADHDKDFQKEILEKLEDRYFSPEMSSMGGYAHLYDRSCIVFTQDNSGDVDFEKSRPQRYASQGMNWGKFWQPFETEDFDNVDRRRLSLGMRETFFEYFKKMNDGKGSIWDVKPITSSSSPATQETGPTKPTVA